MVGNVADTGIRREFDKVVRLERNDVGEDIPPLECEVLDHEVKAFVGVFNAWDGYVSDLDG